MSAHWQTPRQSLKGAITQGMGAVILYKHCTDCRPMGDRRHTGLEHIIMRKKIWYKLFAGQRLAHGCPDTPAGPSLAAELPCRGPRGKTHCPKQA